VQGYPAKLINPQPIPGVKIGPPMVSPQPGQVIVGYQLINGQAGCCKFDDMKVGGYVAIVVLLLVFWPVAMVPCLLDDCYEPRQVPIYEYPQHATQ